MKYSNPVHQVIYDKVVMPAIKSKTMDVEGVVISSNYYNQTVDIFWKDPNSSTAQQVNDVPIPKDGDGIYRESIKNGDKVKISFESGNARKPYISVIQKSNKNRANFNSKYSGGIPKGINFL